MNAPDVRLSQEKDCDNCRSAECASQQRRPGESEEELRQRQALDRKMCQIGYKLLVMSGKGGVGKSTVAANLAASLSASGRRVGLLDVDIHGPSIPKLMGLEEARPEAVGQEIIPVQLAPTLKVMSIGFILPGAADAVIWRGPMKYSAIRQFLRDVQWGPLDYLVIDAPPGTGDEPLSVAQLVGQPAGAVLVTTPQELSLADVRRSVSFCRRLSLPVIGIVENMSGLVCPHCGNPIELFKSGGGEALARETSVLFLGRIPIDPRIVECSDAGIPFVRRFADSPAARALLGIMGRIEEATSVQRQSAANRQVLPDT